jgi:hypothetical protein
VPSGTSAGIDADNKLIINNGATVTATAGTADISYGIFTEELNIVNGTVTATGYTQAIFCYSRDGNYTVPNGVRYWVNTAGTNPGGTGTVSNGNFIITDSHKFARLQN